MIAFEKKKQLEKINQYGKKVKEMYWPSVSEKNQSQMKSLKEKALNENVSQMKNQPVNAVMYSPGAWRNDPVNKSSVDVLRRRKNETLSHGSRGGSSD